LSQRGQAGKPDVQGFPTLANNCIHEPSDLSPELTSSAESEASRRQEKQSSGKSTASPASFPHAAAVPPSVASGWIISPLWDSVLFIGAPLVCIATLLPLSRLWTSEQTAVFLLAFFTFGHHFPGFVRTYEIGNCLPGTD
jgi:hypothetical protein